MIRISSLAISLLGLFWGVIAATPAYADMHYVRLMETGLRTEGGVVRLTADGGCVLAAKVGVDTYSDFNLWIRRYSSDGLVLWEHYLYGETIDEVTSMTITANSDIVIAGWTSNYGAGIQNVLLLRFTDSGDLLWARCYGGLQSDVANAVAETADQGLLIVGYTTSYGAGESDILMIKCTADGDVIWAKTIGSSLDDSASALVVRSETEFVVLGHCNEDPAAYQGDLLYMRCAADGSILTATGYGEYPEKNSVLAAVQTTDQGIVGIAVSAYWVPHGEVTTRKLVKWNQDNTMIWVQNLRHDDAVVGLVSLCGTSDGGVLIAGTTAFEAPTYSDPVIFKLGLDGSFEWAKRLGQALGNDCFNGAQQARDNSYLLTGYSSSFGMPDRSAVLARVDHQGEIANCPYIEPLSYSISTYSIPPIVSIMLDEATQTLDSQPLSLTFTVPPATELLLCEAIAPTPVVTPATGSVGLFALLLGFTFILASGHFGDRLARGNKKRPRL